MRYILALAMLATMLAQAYAEDSTPRIKATVMLCKESDRTVCRDVYELVPEDMREVKSTADCLKGGMGMGSQRFELGGEMWFKSFRCVEEYEGATSALDRPLHAGANQ